MDGIDSLDEREDWLYRWGFSDWEFGIRRLVLICYLNTYMNTIPHKLIFFRRESPARKWMDQCVTFIPVITLKGLEKRNIRTSL